MPIRRHPIATGAPTTSLRALPVDARLIARLRHVFAQLRGQELRLGELFYARLFSAAPHLQALFRSTPAEQADKLVSTLATILQNLDDPARNAEILAELGRRHAAYGAKPQHYDLVIDLLIESMAQLLGPHAAPQHLDEWRMALRLISDHMIAASR